MRILITGGGSEEAIDNVRAVTNFSTGRTSAFLADFFAGLGHEVTELVSERAEKPRKASLVTYKSFLQLAKALESECKSGGYALIVHAAAVSDYSPTEIEVDGRTFECGQMSKIPSGAELVVRMRKNPKLVDSLKLWSGDKTKVFAFKLTSNAGEAERQEAVLKVFRANKNHHLSPDFVVSNDLSQIKGDLHRFKIFSWSQKNESLDLALEGENLTALAEGILKLAGG